MKIWVGVTDKAWVDHLAARAPEEVNFWQPSGRTGFRAIPPGAPFLFKLHAPYHCIAGGGWFGRYSPLPPSLAWQAFGTPTGAAQRAVAARAGGREVIYQGSRLTPAQLAAVARDEDVDLIGLSILSGSHLELVSQVVSLLEDEGISAPVVAGGIIPDQDQHDLLEAHVAAIYTPKNFELSKIMGEILDLVIARRGA